MGPGKLPGAEPQDLSGDCARRIGTEVRHRRADVFAIDEVGPRSHGRGIRGRSDRRRSKHVGADTDASFLLRNGRC